MKLLRGSYLGLGLFLVSSAAPPEAQVAEVAKLLEPDGSFNHIFGGAVSIFGDRAIVGARGDADLGFHSGSAYVFERNAEGAWTQTAKLQASDGAEEHYFGMSVSIFGDRALVGATGNDAAYVFERDAGGTWTQVAKLKASDGAEDSGLGIAVSLSGHRALVGAYGDDDHGIHSGSTYLFERNAGGAWIQVAKLLASDGAAFDYFGNSVSISRDRALVGAYEDDDPGLDSGSAYMFERKAGGTWTQVAKLNVSDSAPNDFFGSSVSVSGDRALVGVNGDSDLGADSGSAYVFERKAGGIWTQVAKLLASDGAVGDHFGGPVSISGDRALIGSSFDDDLGFGCGSAYVFERTAGGAWGQVGKLLASDGGKDDGFGGAVSIHGDHALVGASDDNEFGVASGSAYVFEGSASVAPLPPTETVRLGSPPNPNALLPGLTGGPVLGSTWEPIIDHATFLTGAAFDLIGIAVSPINLNVPPLGTLLCYPTPMVAIETVPAGTCFAVLFPSDPAFAGVSLCAQGASVEESGTILLTNALDLTIGTF